MGSLQEMVFQEGLRRCRGQREQEGGIPREVRGSFNSRVMQSFWAKNIWTEGQTKLE